MRLGVSIRSGYAHVDAATAARWMVDRAIAAEAAGLDSLFVGDHHAVPVPYIQNSPILGRLSAVWGPRTIGALYLLPLWNPVLVAEQVGTLAAMAEGPFVLQCAIGGGETQFAAMGATLRTRPSRFEASLAVIRALLSGDQVDGVRIGAVPDRPVGVWIGAEAAVGIERAARLGDAWLAGPGPLPADVAAQLAIYREARSSAALAPGSAVIRRDVHVAETDARAAEEVRDVIGAGYRGFDTESLVIGSPETVARQLAALGELGFDEVLVRHLADDQGAVLRSFAFLGEVRRRLA